MRIVEDRFCPACGHVLDWQWGLVRHVIGHDKFVHVRLRVERENGSVVCMASILKNGRALKE